MRVILSVKSTCHHNVCGFSYQCWCFWQTFKKSSVSSRTKLMQKGHAYSLANSMFIKQLQ